MMRIFNKYTIIGIVLIVLGIPLSVVWIGIPLMIIGFLIGDFGIVYGIVKIVPGLEGKTKRFFGMVKDSYKPYFKEKPPAHRASGPEGVNQK